jgi:hypothetical protein
MLTDLSEEQPDGILRRVRASIEGIKAGKFIEYEGPEGLKKLADGVKVRGVSSLPETLLASNAQPRLRGC